MTDARYARDNRQGVTPAAPRPGPLGRLGGLDATVIRMLLVPAVMHLLGRHNRWLPAARRGTCPTCISKDRHDVRARLDGGELISAR
jgi:hypothetical protein